MLKGSWLALALAVAIYPAATAHAQGGFYAEGTYTWISGNTVGGDSASGPTGKATGIGGSFGTFYDFLHLGPLALGADLRYSFSHDGSPSLFGNELNYGDAGVRISGKVPKAPVRPFAQAGVLRSSTNYAYHTAMHGGLGYGYQFGADVDVVPHIDLRVEYAGGYSGGMGTGVGTTTTSLTFNQIQAGFVIWYGR
jgi:hypothetical protein